MNHEYWKIRESSNKTKNKIGRLKIEDDSDYNPENDYSSSEDDEDITTDEDLTDDESIEDIDLSDMFFYKFGKGFLLKPKSNHELYGQKYLLDGWWMPKHKSWFFKAEFEDTLLIMERLWLQIRHQILLRQFISLPLCHLRHLHQRLQRLQTSPINLHQ